MKKRTILSLALAAMVFTAIALQLNKEVIAETQVILPRVVIYSSNGVNHGNYIVYLVNLTRDEMTLLDPSPRWKAPGYPAIHGGGGGGLTTFNSGDNYLLSICGGGSGAWGVNSPTFHLPVSDDIVVTVVPGGCVSNGN